MSTPFPTPVVQQCPYEKSIYGLDLFNALNEWCPIFSPTKQIEATFANALARQSEAQMGSFREPN